MRWATNVAFFCGRSDIGGTVRSLASSRLRSIPYYINHTQFFGEWFEALANRSCQRTGIVSDLSARTVAAVGELPEFARVEDHRVDVWVGLERPDLEHDDVVISGSNLVPNAAIQP
jgi:hypothetical protein